MQVTRACFSPSAPGLPCGLHCLRIPSVPCLVFLKYVQLTHPGCVRRPQVAVKHRAVARLRTHAQVRISPISTALDERSRDWL